MASLSEKIAAARKAGFSDAEIQSELMSSPKFEAARKAGFSDAEILSELGLAAPKDEGLTTERAAKVMAGAAAPTVAGLAGGAALGALGGTAIAPAAALGAGALGAAELVGNVYNLGRSAFGYEPVKTPFQYIRQATESAFPSVAPQTPTENVLRAATEGGLGALTGAGAARTGANLIAQSGRAVPSVVNALAAQPVAQAVSGAAGAAVPEALYQGGETNPYVLGASGLAAGLGAGRMAAGVTSPARATTGELAGAKRGRMEVREQTAWNRAYGTGGQYDNNSFNAFNMNANARLRQEGFMPGDPELRPVERALDHLTDAGRSNVLDMREIHRLRRRIGDISTSQDPNVRRLGGILSDEFDNFIRDPANARQGIDPRTGVPFQDQVARGIQYMDRAIDTSSRLFRNDEIREAIRLASVSRQDPLGALRNEFGKIFRDPDRLRQFSADDQRVIEDLAAGRASPRAVQLLGSLAPGASWSGVAKGAVEFGPALAAATTPAAAVVSPSLALGLAGLGAGSIMARRAQNALATRASHNLLASTLGGVPALPPDYRSLSPLLAAGMQGVNAMAR